MAPIISKSLQKDFLSSPSLLYLNIGFAKRVIFDEVRKTEAQTLPMKEIKGDLLFHGQSQIWRRRLKALYTYKPQVFIHEALQCNRVMLRSLICNRLKFLNLR